MKIKHLLWIRILVIINLICIIGAFLYNINAFPLFNGLSFFLLICLILEDLKYPKLAVFFFCSYFGLKLTLFFLNRSMLDSDTIFILKVIEIICFIASGLYILKTRYKYFGLAIVLSMVLNVMEWIVFRVLVNKLIADNFYILIDFTSFLPSLVLGYLVLIKKNDSHIETLYE